MILVSFSLRRIIEFDFYPTNLLPIAPFSLTFVMENLINYANFRDTHSDDNLMQWYPEGVYPVFFCTQISDLGSDLAENGIKFRGLR